MADKPVRTFGPLALTATLTTNVYNQSSALIADKLNYLILANKTAASHTVTLYLGATGANTAGTEILFGYVVPANTTIVYPLGGLVMKSTDFLVGGADAGTAITITGEGYQYVV